MTIQTVRKNMSFILWSVQYATYSVGKNEALFDIRLNNHRKYIKYLRVILADKNFQKMAIDLTNMQDSR